MAIVTSFNYGAGFASVIGATERLAFSESSTAIASIPSGQYATQTIVVDSAFTTVVGATQNTQYISKTSVDLGAGPVLLDTTNVATTAVSFRMDWQDDALSTALTNGKFYVFDAVTPTTAPVGATFVAFERGVATINVNRIGGDTLGLAWDDAGGIGGSANALLLEDQASAATHSFYIGVSAKPTVYGQNSGIRFRLEFDAQ